MTEALAGSRRGRSDRREVEAARRLRPRDDCRARLPMARQKPSQPSCACMMDSSRKFRRHAGALFSPTTDYGREALPAWRLAGDVRASRRAFLRDVETRPGSPEAGVAHRAYGVTQWFTGNFVEARIGTSNMRWQSSIRSAISAISPSASGRTSAFQRWSIRSNRPVAARRG